MKSADPIEGIPDPDAVRAMLAASVRRSELLRSLLNVAVRKAAYDRPHPVSHSPDPHAEAGRAVRRG